MYSPPISGEETARQAELLARASAILITKVPLQNEAFSLSEDIVEVMIIQMTKFEWASVPEGQAMPLKEGCQGLTKMLNSERCRDLITEIQLVSIIEGISDSLVANDEEEETWDLTILEEVSRALLESCRGGVPATDLQTTMIGAINALWETDETRSVAWALWWTQWLEALIGQGVWPRALVARCYGIQRVAGLMQRHRSDYRMLRDGLHVFIRLSSDRLGKEEVMQADG